MTTINEKTSVESLKCFLLEVKENALFITANNLESNIIGSIKCKMIEAGKTLVHAKTFHQIISKLSEGNVSLYLSDNNTLLIVSEESTFNIFILKTDEFPENMKPGELKYSFSMDKTVLKDILKKVSFSASNQDDKLILNGVYIDINAELKKLIFVAADGYRLSKDELSMPTLKDSGNCIIPLQGIDQLLQIIPTISSDIIKISIYSDIICFECETIILFSRLIKGRFPDYSLLIPKEHTVSLQVSRRKLLEGCERVNIIAQRNSNMVKVELLDFFMIISAVTPDLGDGSEKIPIELTGSQSITLIINVKLIIDVLKNIETDDLIIQIINEEKPIIVKEKNNEKFTYVMMPIKVKREESTSK